MEKPDLVPVEGLTEQEKAILRGDAQQEALACLTGGFDYDGGPVPLNWTGGRRSLECILVMGEPMKALSLGQLRDYNTMVMYCSERPELRLDTPDMLDYATAISLGGFRFLLHMRILRGRENYRIYAFPLK